MRYRQVKAYPGSMENALVTPIYYSVLFGIIVLLHLLKVLYYNSMQPSSRKSIHMVVDLEL